MGLFGKTKKNSGWMAIDCQSDGICVAHVNRPPVGRPTVELVSFYPADKTALPAMLDKLAKELHLDRYRCSYLLHPGEYQLLSVDTPNVPPDELKNAIRWRLNDMLDYRVDDATIDVLAVPFDKDGPVRSNTLFAVAARNQLIAQRQALFHQAKIALRVIDIPEMAQRNISALLEPEGRAVALLSFNAEGGVITVTFGGELYLSRRIGMTVMQPQQADISQKAAIYERITLELQRSLDHFDRQYHSMPLSKLILSPMGLDGAGLQEYLVTNLHTPVETLVLESVLDFSKVPELNKPESQQRYFMVIGAALRHEDRVAL